VQEDVVVALRSDARFYITTKGVLGDPFLEIDPGYEKSRLDISKPVFGIDPPRLDIFLADAADLVDGLNRLLGRNAENLDQILGGGARIVRAVENLMDGGVRTDRFERIVQNVESLLEETSAFINGAREKFVDNPKLERTISNIETLSKNLNTDVDPLLKDVRETLAMVQRLGDAIGPKEQASLKSALMRLDGIAVKADKLIVKVDGMVERIRRGEGTVGRFTADEELYDDIKELIRDIKQHPWKLIWEE
jgi:phospholipid/cholesterol/gamma-HCH transport system substrate-binding protein